MELYAQIALMLEKNSDAMIYVEVMKNMSDTSICDREFRYKYLLAQIYMLSGLNEEAIRVALECRAIVEEQGNEFDMFRVELINFLSGYSGWKKKMFLDRNAEVSDALLEKAEKYGYYNQLAHIYIFAFDNKGEQFRDIEKQEENLKHFYKGIELAKSLGNEGLLAEGYKKNVMMASTNGFFDISNYYYELLMEVDLIKNDAFEMANIYNGLGYNNCTAEKFEKAHEYYNKALIIFDNIREPVYAGETLYNMALNAMLTNEYEIASKYLEQCLFILKIFKRDGFRICNISKLYGLLTICYYRMGEIYSSRMNLQSSIQYLDHLYTTDVNDKGTDKHLWGDDLFLCHYNNALLLMFDEKYEESLKEFLNAREYIEASPGFQFFSVAQYCIDLATLYKRMDRESDAEQILETGMQFCEERGYGFKTEMISSYCNEMEMKPVRWNLSLNGINLEQIENHVKALALQYSNKRQEHNMEFLSVWQKTVDGYADTTENLVVTSIKTFKKYFNIDYTLFIRFENGEPVVKYNDSSNSIQKEQVNYLVNFFKDNRSEVITSRTEINYYEYKELMDTVLCNDRINSVIFAPIYKNDKMDSIFVSYSFLRDSWNSLNSKMVCDKEELPIFMFFFREFMASIDRLEDKIEISKMNHKLQEANSNLSQYAAKADAANKAKSDFLAKMSHEIRTPINELIFDIDQNMPVGLFGDDIRLKQILVNLLTNAVKYTHEGTVILRAKSEMKGDKVLLSIKVTDTGIGIKEEDINKLFVKFERIEESRNRNIEGTGLGMNITLQLLKLMGSELKVKSEYGKGSEFSFCIEQGITNFTTLGDFHEGIHQMESQSNSTLSYVAPNAKILVVDDNEMNRKVFRSLLKKSQMKVSNYI